MEGCGNMVDYSVSAHVKALTEYFIKEKEEYDSLPLEERKKKAHDELVKIGVIDQDGNITEPYAALGARYVQ